MLVSVDHLGEALDALVVDHGRNAAQHDDLPLAAQLLGEPVGGVGAHRDVVAGDIEILDAGIGQAAVHDGDEGAGILDRARPGRSAPPR